MNIGHSNKTTYSMGKKRKMRIAVYNLQCSLLLHVMITLKLNCN